MARKKTNWWLPGLLAIGSVGLIALLATGTDKGKAVTQKVKDMVSEHLNKNEFAKRYYPFAKDSEKNTGVPALVTLAQAALESGWGKSAPQFNFFGIKADRSWSGERQLLRTTEYLPKGVSFPEIISTEITTRKNSKGEPLYKYVIRDWFRAYTSPEGSFRDKGNFLRTNQRYKPAFNHTDPFKFATEVAKAGYATDPDYESKLHRLISDFQKILS